MDNEPSGKRIKTESIVNEEIETIIICKFCNDILDINLFDKNKMIHCQGCHNIWNGQTQCYCF
jgi:hypothetical protein